MVVTIKDFLTTTIEGLKSDPVFPAALTTPNRKKELNIDKLFSSAYIHLHKNLATVSLVDQRTN